MRPNHAKRKIMAGVPVLATGFGIHSLPDSLTLEYLAQKGALDVAWIEFEHGAASWRDLSEISRICDLCGATSLVRLANNNAADIGRALDLGVQCIMMPHVNSGEEAERLARAAYYTPKGLRGIGQPRQGFGDDQYFQKANDEVLTIAMIEDVEAIRNLDEILSVRDIDVFFVAPADLAQTMGPEYLGKPFHPEVQALVVDTVRRITAEGRATGAIVNENNVDALIEAGVRLVRFSALEWAVAGVKRFRDRVDQLAGAAGAPG